MEVMHLFQHRLNSFGKRGYNWPHKHFKATALRLAQVGFYYDSKDLYNDKVTCYLCKCSYHGWKKDDIPLEIHKKTSPECPIVIILDYSRNWIRNPVEDQTYEPISSKVLKARIDTFKDWWPHTYPNISPEQIAEAGLYFSADVDSEDKVECAYCKAKFDNWTSNDNPRSKHFRFNEKCPFFCVPKIKRRKLKKIEKNNKKEKAAKQKEIEFDSDSTDNNKNKKNKRNKKKMEEDDEEEDDTDNDENNENEVKVKKTYNTRYATREIKKVNYVENDTTDDEFLMTDSDEEGDEDGEEGDEDGEEEEDGKEEKEEDEDDDEYIDELQDDSILIDGNRNELNNNQMNENLLTNNSEKENMDNEDNKDIENNTEEKEMVNEEDENLTEKKEEETRENKKSDDEYVKSDSDSSYTSSSYDDSYRRRSSAKKKKTRKKYKKRKIPVLEGLDESMFIDDELDSEEEKLRNRRIKRLFSTENGYLGPLPKIKSKTVIEEEKKLYEEMVKKAEDNPELGIDLKNTNPEFVSVASILRKRKKQSISDEFSLSNKRISLSNRNSLTMSPDKILSESNKIENNDNDNDNDNKRSLDILDNIDNSKNINSINKEINNDDNNNSINSNKEIFDKKKNNIINHIVLKTPITIKEIQKEKDFTIVKVSKSNDKSNKYSNNLLASISKQKIDDILKDTPIKLIKNNNTNMKNTPLKFSEEELYANNLFMINDENNLDLLKEKIIEILLENNKADNENNNSSINDNKNDEEINDNINTSRNANSNDNQTEINNTTTTINNNNNNEDNDVINNKNENEIEAMDIDIDLNNNNNNQSKTINNNNVIEILDDGTDKITTKNEEKENYNEINNNNNHSFKEGIYESLVQIKKEVNQLKNSVIDKSNDDRINSNLSKEIISNNVDSKLKETNNITDDKIPESKENHDEYNILSKLKDNTENSNNDNNNILLELKENNENDIFTEFKENSNKVSTCEKKINFEEIDEEEKNGKTTDVKRKEFYEIKSSEKKILKELSFSITTPEPNSPKINITSEKSDIKTFKTPLSSQVKNFNLSSDISIEESFDALLSTPTPLPLGINSKSFLKNDKDLLIKTIMEENKKSLRKLNKSSEKQTDTKKGEKFNLKTNDSTKTNKINNNINNDNNISFLSCDDNNFSFMYRNDDSIVVRANQKSNNNLDDIYNTINKLKETINTVEDASIIILDDKKNILSEIKEHEDNKDNNKETNTNKKSNKNLILSSELSNNTTDEEEILDNYFNYLTNTPNTKTTDKKDSYNKEISVDENDILSMTVGQYLEKINQDISQKLKIEGEKKISDYYQQLFNIEDLYLQFLDKMVNQLQEYPKDKMILENQTKSIKNTLNNDRKTIKMEIETTTSLNNQQNKQNNNNDNNN